MSILINGYMITKLMSMLNRRKEVYMRICHWCNKKIEEGYLVDDYYVMCEDCRLEIYTEEEFDNQYCKGEIFWTTFYDEDIK